MKKFCALLLLAGCASVPTPPPNIAQPPATTRDACDSLRHFFKRAKVRSVTPENITTECHLRMASGVLGGPQLRSYLEKSGWIRDANYRKDSPGAYAYETPAARCTITEIQNYSAGGPVRPGVGMAVGSGMPPTYGVGVSAGSALETDLDYQIDCQSKTR